jgi:hypothetical protein
MCVSIFYHALPFTHHLFKTSAPTSKPAAIDWISGWERAASNIDWGGPARIHVARNQNWIIHWMVHFAQNLWSPESPWVWISVKSKPQKPSDFVNSERQEKVCASLLQHMGFLQDRAGTATQSGKALNETEMQEGHGRIRHGNQM